MKIKIISLGTNMPVWITQGYREYTKRLSTFASFELIEIPLLKRSNTHALTKIIEQESQSLLNKIKLADFVIALDVQGEQFDTETLAKNLQNWLALGRDLCFLIGGPEGLTEQCKKRADKIWSLAKLTFPHPLVRIIITEQLYRAWSILQGHPYHRGTT